ncbi:MAG: site-specific DNA-methyltransferase [Thermoplasmata archaeon]|nr:site-specific DNA-methyltransferase [Thermoplasmata archaeon]
MKMVLIHGDSLKVLPKLEQKVDLVIADPPYFVLEKAKVQEIAKKWDFFHSVDEYREFTIRWLNEVYRLLKDGGSCLVFWSEKHMFLFGEIVKQTHFKLHKTIIWHYPNVLKGFSSKRWINTFDFVFHLVKGNKPKVFNAKFTKDENKDVQIFPKPQCNFVKDRKWHTTQKPLELIKRFVKILTNEGDWVLDPFLGSGTTMLACLQLNRNCVGIEINEEYIQIIKRRLNWGSSLGNVEFKFREVEEHD